MKLREDVIQGRQANSTINMESLSHNQTAPQKPQTTSEKYEWEKHSSKSGNNAKCTARNVINKMGFRGKGLGKKENGIEEALTTKNVSATLG